MANDLDMLLELAVSQAELANGTDVAVQVARSTLHPALVGMKPAPLKKAPEWSLSEKQYLAEHHAQRSEEDIARTLGRSVMGVHLQWKRQGLPAPTKQPDWITCNKVSKLMGIDVHKVTGWIETGIMPGELIPMRRKILRVNKTALKRWLTRPQNWVYFDHRSITNARLRRLVELAKERWQDEWWDLPRAAEYHNCDKKDILRYVYHGDVPAIQAPNIGGRSGLGWSRWFIKKSDAVKLVVRRGRGTGHELPANPPRDAYIVLGKAVGFSSQWLGEKTGMTSKGVDYLLHQRAKVRAIIEENNLPVTLDANGTLFADWRNAPGRFPALERAVARLTGWMRGENEAPQQSDLILIAGVIRAWANHRKVNIPMRPRKEIAPERVADAWEILFPGTRRHANTE